MSKVCSARLAISILTTCLKIPMATLHTKCAMGTYPRADHIARTVAQVDWNVQERDYSPVDYTAPVILKQPPWADKMPCDPGFKAAWNTLDGAVDRRSHEGEYTILESLPRNPHGRTGIVGRGLLGRFGPNHAADPVVTRWKRTSDGKKILHEVSKLPVLQFVSILRGDGGGWAIPGGMVDPGEVVSQTLRREFMEEAMNSNDMTDEQKQRAVQQITDLFKKGVDVYRGYVDDPRNTDNAWMETVAQNFHQDEAEGILTELELSAGDDAAAVRWQDVSSELKLYASHADIVNKTVTRLAAHW
uniref:ADP-ribose pyrophosphatase n=1 Tax=Hirondellea gigas TaxID=1518452 RepID=A0A2P2I2L5_9CRUS